MRPRQSHFAPRAFCASFWLFFLAILFAPGLAVAQTAHNPANEYKVLYEFCSLTGCADGQMPYAGLVRDAGGNLYGTTLGGGGGTFCTLDGVTGCGVVFKLDARGNETVLYSFDGGSDGGLPYGGLVRDAAGNLYGTTSGGGNGNGQDGCGVAGGPFIRVLCE
jgi:uncharacterized repeat protein (TIGR03803 family)